MPEYCRSVEMAKILGIKPQSFYEYTRKSLLTPSHRVGNRMMFKPLDVLREAERNGIPISASAVAILASHR